MTRIAFAVLTLAIAGCRGNAPEDRGRQPDTAPRTNRTAESVSTPLVDWTDGDLERVADRVGYGPKPTATLQRKGGVLVFTPETAKDHVAMPFTPLPPYAGSRSLELIVDAESSGGMACAANLQDQGYHLLTTVPCATAGEQRHTVAVTPDVTGIRVYFQSAMREPIQLPRRIRVIEHR
jgi:hypothetical protein